MKMRALGIFSLALSLCLFSIAEAQRPGGGGGQRGGGAGGQRGGPGGGGFGGQRGGGAQGATQVLGLLRTEEVRKDIELDDETASAITDAVREAMPDREKMRDASEEERAEMGKKAESAAKDVIDEALTPKQLNRLLGLLVQQSGYAAAQNTLIAEKIGLDADGIKKVAEAVSESRTKMFEKMRESRGAGGGGERPDFAKMMADMREGSDEVVAKVLTKDQVQQLDEMKGEKFDFPAPQFGGRGGPGGQDRGGAGGQGGRGGRPGQG
ncbi:MAG: hypothetical protein WBD20_27475, partial [Pirellulaceae bacterium]